jgi:hypothetical protein
MRKSETWNLSTIVVIRILCVQGPGSSFSKFASGAVYYFCIDRSIIHECSTQAIRKQNKCTACLCFDLTYCLCFKATQSHSNFLRQVRWLR